MQLSGLNIYPVKSGRGITLSTSVVHPTGLENDRHWVIVQTPQAGNSEGFSRFISQRTHPDLACLNAKPDNDRLYLSMDGSEYVLDLKAPIISETVSVWQDSFPATLYNDPVNDWLSERLGGTYKLASMTGARRTRRENEDFARQYEADFDVSFADAYPVLIATHASLEALNGYVEAQGESALTMSRFRPNLVVDGAQPWAEDGWKRVKIGEVEFICVKPCTRCIMTTLDPVSGQSRGDISLRALTHLRRSADKRLKGVLFGTNAIPLNQGRVRMGDKVEVLEKQPSWPVHKN